MRRPMAGSSVRLVLMLMKPGLLTPALERVEGLGDIARQRKINHGTAAYGRCSPAPCRAAGVWQPPTWPTRSAVPSVLPHREGSLKRTSRGRGPDARTG